MPAVTVGKWGRNLAIRIPAGVASTVGLCDGETVEVESSDDGLIIRRSAARTEARRQAEAAAVEIEAESKQYRLGGVTIRELLDEGRRG